MSLKLEQANPINIKMPLKGCYIDVKGAGESSVQCWWWHWLIQSEGRGPDPQLVQG